MKNRNHKRRNLILIILAAIIIIMPALAAGFIPLQLPKTVKEDQTAAAEEVSRQSDQEDQSAAAEEVSRQSDQEDQSPAVGESSQHSDRLTSEKMAVHFIDVGQGDATLIVSDGHSMLIDAGDSSKGTRVQKYLMDQGVDALDYAVCTHPDEDHIGGMDVILTKFSCEQVIIPDVLSDNKSYAELMDVISDRMIDITEPVPGTGFALGEAECTIVAPAGEYEADDLNNWSAGLKISCGEVSFLFTGDAESAAEQDMIMQDIDLDSTVFKLGHHGSSSSSTPDFLDAVSPEYAVISCGTDNEYGHPSGYTLEELKARDIQVFRTDLQGTVTALTDGRVISWNMEPDQSWTPGKIPQESDGSEGETEEGKTQKGKAVEDDENRPEKIDESGVVSGEAAQRSGVEGFSYILNTNTMKFHYPDCPSVDDMSKRNKSGSNRSREELIEDGYSPCGRCKP